MISKEDSDKIYKIAEEHYKEFDILKDPKEGSLQDKAQKIHQELPTVYRKLEEEKLLPDGMNLNIFMQILTERLQIEAQKAHAMKMFGMI